MEPKHQESTIEIVCDHADEAEQLAETALFETTDQQTSARSTAPAAPLIKSDGFDREPWKRRQFVNNLAPKPAYANSETPDDPRFYAGFWRRLAANFVDWIIVSLIGGLVVLVLSSVAPLLDPAGVYSIQALVLGSLLGLIYYAGFNLIPVLSSLVPPILFHGGFTGSASVMLILSYVSVILGPFLIDTIYRASMESSIRQATLGKMLLGIRVVDRNGEKLTFLHAVVRHLCKGVSSLILMIGFILAATGKRKEALHDKIAKTLVIRTDKAPAIVAAGAESTAEPISYAG